MSSQPGVVGGADPTEGGGLWGRLPFPYLGGDSVGSWASWPEPVSSRKAQNPLPQSTSGIGPSLMTRSWPREKLGQAAGRFGWGLGSGTFNEWHIKGD